MASPASSQHYIQLAKTLPPRLLQFLARYPPAAILPAATATTTTDTGATPAAPTAAKATTTLYQEQTPNPFQATKHPVTGRWHDPVYSLRRQAELVKLARDHGVAELMPASVKSPEARLRKRVELGLRVKGTGVGQKVKGHQHERHLVAKMEERRQAMLNMPKLIREWKRVSTCCHGLAEFSTMFMLTAVGRPEKLDTVPELSGLLGLCLRLVLYPPMYYDCIKAPRGAFDMIRCSF